MEEGKGASAEDVCLAVGIGYGIDEKDRVGGEDGKREGCLVDEGNGTVTRWTREIVELQER